MAKRSMPRASSTWVSTMNEKIFLRYFLKRARTFMTLMNLKNLKALKKSMGMNAMISTQFSL